MKNDLINDYRDYLLKFGLADQTVRHNLHWIRRFLGYLDEIHKSVNDIIINDIDTFLSIWLPKLNRKTRRVPISAIRKYTEYLHSNEIIEKDLSTQIIGVRIYRNESLPRGLKQEDIQNIILNIDTQKKNGKRDFAVVLLFATYGLRLGELINIQISDINWKQETLSFYRSKTMDYLTLPLLPSVGNAILDYLMNERKSIADNQTLFPIKCEYKEGCISRIIHKYAKLANVPLNNGCTHLFRHSLATEMVRNDIPMKTISDTLGHKHISSTYIYAKCNIDKLRTASLCPPEEQK